MRRLLFVLLAASCARAPSRPAADPAQPANAQPANAQPGQPTPHAEAGPLGKLPREVHPLRESLVLALDPAKERFSGTAELSLQFDAPRDTLWLHGRSLAVREVSLTLPSGEKLAAQWQEADPTGVARVTLPRAVGAGPATLRIVYDAPYDDQLVGIYRAGGAVFSKFEAIYARRAFPCFDEPSFKTPFEVALEVPAQLTALSNMPVAATEPLANGHKRVRFAPTPPLPSYLILFAVGDFESKSASLPANEVRPAPLPVSVVALRGRVRELAYPLSEALDLVAEQERYFGIAFPYPKLDLIAVPDFQSGAMENAGAITFRDQLLLLDEEHAAQSQRISVTSVISHELAHQWFGDLVTMPWWDEIWLNEGFANWMDTRTLRAVRPQFEEELGRIEQTDRVMDTDALVSARRIRQPIESTHDITNAFDGITYSKGEAVLGMVESYVGADEFRRGLHAYLSAHAGGNATTAELVSALSAEAGSDLGPLFSSFLDQPGVPLVTVRRAPCAKGKSGLELSQQRWLPAGSTAPHEGLWRVPVCLDADGKKSCQLLGEKQARVQLDSCPGAVFPNEGGAGYYRFSVGAADLAALAARKHAPAAERLSLALNLDAAFRSASLPAADVLRALEPLARDAHGTVAGAPLGLYSFLDDRMPQPKLRAHLSALYAPALARLGYRASPGDTPSTRLFRASLVRFLALQLEQPSVLAELSRLGALYVAKDGLHPDAVERDLAGAAAAARARTGGVQAFDDLLAALMRTDDSQLRDRMLTALGSVRDPQLVQRALQLALDPRLHKSERLGSLFPLLNAATTRDAAWAWLTQHFDELAALLPDRYAAYLIQAPSFCSAAQAAQLKAFFAPRVEKLTGGPRILSQTLERIELCAAQVQAQRASVHDSFASK